MKKPATADMAIAVCRRLVRLPYNAHGHVVAPERLLDAALRVVEPARKPRR